MLLWLFQWQVVALHPSFQAFEASLSAVMLASFIEGPVPASLQLFALVVDQ